MNVRLVSRFALSLVAFSGLVPLVGCGSDDDDTSAPGRDAGIEGSAASGEDSGSGDATTGQDASGSSGKDSGLDTGVIADAGSDAAHADAGAAADAGDAASGNCRAVNGYYDLKGPGASSATFCPTESGVTCHFATEANSCELVSQCSSDDGGLGTGFFAIPSGMLDGNDSLTYTTSYAVPLLGSFSASCTLRFSGDLATATLTCSGSAPVVGTLASCSYSGVPTDAGR